MSRQLGPKRPHTLTPFHCQQGRLRDACCSFICSFVFQDNSQSCIDWLWQNILHRRVIIVDLLIDSRCFLRIFDWHSDSITLDTQGVQYKEHYEILLFCAEFSAEWMVGWLPNCQPIYRTPSRSARLRNDLYCVEWDVKLFYIIPYLLAVSEQSSISPSTRHRSFQRRFFPVNQGSSIKQTRGKCQINENNQTGPSETRENTLKRNLRLKLKLNLNLNY